MARTPEPFRPGGGSTKKSRFAGVGKGLAIGIIFVVIVLLMSQCMRIQDEKAAAVAAAEPEPVLTAFSRYAFPSTLRDNETGCEYIVVHNRYGGGTMAMSVTPRMVRTPAGVVQYCADKPRGRNTGVEG